MSSVWRDRFPALLLLAVLSCARERALRAEAPPRHLVLAATGDLHGWLDGHEVTYGDRRLRIGGLDVLGGYLANLRAANPSRVVLLDGGDLFQGTLVSNTFEGEPVVKAMNLLAYDGAAVGNHEFDYGPLGPHAVAREAGEDPLGALKRNAGTLRFPLLAANITERATGRRPGWLKPQILIEVSGIRVGVIGLSTPTTPSVTMEANVKSLAFGDPAAAAVESARVLRQQGADAVVVVAHMGGSCRDVSDPRDARSCDATAESFRLVEALPAGTIDAYFGGHTHQQVRQFVNGVPVVQAAPLGRGLGVVDLWVDSRAHRVLADRTQIRPLTMVCAAVFSGTATCDPRDLPRGAPAQSLVTASFEGRPVAPRIDVQDLLRPYLAEVARQRGEPLGIRLAGPFTPNYRRESTLGDLVADALRDAVPGADFGLTNSGGLRASLRGPDVTFGEMFEVLPFDNLGATVRVSGADLRRLLAISADGSHGTLQVSGLTAVLDAAKDAKERVVSLSLADGRPLEPDRLFTVATTDFLAGGGDGWRDVLATLPPDRVRILDVSLRDLVIAALKKRAAAGPLKPATDGRLRVLNLPAENDSVR